MSGHRPNTGLPAPIAGVGILGAVVIVAPLVALAWAAPWGRMWSLLTASDAMAALGLSMGAGILATALAILLGVPLAAVLASDAIRPTRLVRLLVIVPMVMPPVVVGTALLTLLGRRGLLGRYLDAWFDWTPTYTFWAVVIAQLVVAMPFLVVSVEASLRTRNIDAEECAYTLGAGRLTTFWRVTLPEIRGGIAAGAVMCFARALGEFGATITFAGNVQGVTQTMPLAIYLDLQRDDDAAIAMAVGLVVLSILVLVVMRGRWMPALSSPH
ncbi:molybdate ABC transporter permease subunit [Gordonia sp. PP30]|uniref:molybdate ABC transporter permease subunit n=1 Tax=unclassified Gordonia (in: high G+C Gram-positive bacteria) TaxID=2657482 RepID=UPI001FFEAC5F|nr:MULTISPECIES: molybdate ABC transporter permease subunit [unclassified Gordonia (in: high G+C Gram-positive bacteria)]UQE76494.1 molybdate ABC transporter permease subunit [Gordonia sp. PP30]